MSFTPYDWEREERRDSERFATYFDDGPDPSEYEDRDDPPNPYGWDEEEYADQIDAARQRWLERQNQRKPGYIDENAVLRGLLNLLVIVLISLMLWILAGAMVVRFLRWAF
jgi:hypothetical protein